MKNNYLLAALVVGISPLCSKMEIQAAPIFNFAREGGNQQNFDLGMDFDVNSAVTVTALGTYDPNIAGISGPVSTAQIAASLVPGPNSSDDALNIYVGIFDTLTGIEVSPTAVFNTAGAVSTPYFAIGGSIFQTITAFTLGPGHYSIVATGYTFDFHNGNVNLGSTSPTFDTLAGALTLLPNGARYDIQGTHNGLPLVLPTDTTGQTEVGGNPTFLAGTFIANNSSVPDGGSTIALLGLAFLGIAGLRKKISA